MCVSPNTSPTAAFGIFDSLSNAFSNAFSNAEYKAPPEGVKSTARHILVPSVEIAADIKSRISKNDFSFTQAAGKFSNCPSKTQGGSLGLFPPGRMVPEFDAVVFDPASPVGDTLETIKTKFGAHLIKIEKRSVV